MRLLLDTHIWLWSLLTPDRLTSPVAQALESDEAELWLSPISTWELVVLVGKGRVRIDGDLDTWIRRAHERAALREAPVTHEIAVETSRFDLPHRDPADRFLVATARVLGLTLVTADDRLIDARQVAVLENR